MTPEEQEEDARRRAAFGLLRRFDALEDSRSHWLHVFKQRVIATIDVDPAEAERLAHVLLDMRAQSACADSSVG